MLLDFFFLKILSFMDYHGFQCFKKGYKKDKKIIFFVSRNALTELTGAKLVHFMSKDNNIYCY